MSPDVGSLPDSQEDGTPFGISSIYNSKVHHVGTFLSDLARRKNQRP